MIPPLWVKVDGKWEVFPGEHLTRFEDGKWGFDWAASFNVYDTVHRELLRLHGDKFEFDRTWLRYVLKDQFCVTDS